MHPRTKDSPKRPKTALPSVSKRKTLELREREPTRFWTLSTGKVVELEIQLNDKSEMGKAGILDLVRPPQRGNGEPVFDEDDLTEIAGLLHDHSPSDFNEFIPELPTTEDALAELVEQKQMEGRHWRQRVRETEDGEERLKFGKKLKEAEWLSFALSYL